MRIRCVDVETTGTEAGDEIIEIGAWDIVDAADAGAAQIESVGEQFVKPRKAVIRPEARAVHHITDSLIETAEPFEAVWPRFAPDRSVAAFAAHKCEFERRWLTSAVTGDGIAWICTWRCALRLWPEAPNHHLQTLRYFLNLPVDPEIANQAHRAWPDAYTCAFLLRRMLDEAPYETLVAWSGFPGLLPLCTIGKFRGQPWPNVEIGFLQWMLRQPDMAPDLLFSAKHELNRRGTSV